MAAGYQYAIRNIYPELSESERKVADFALANMPVLLRMSLRELKEGAGVSEPTVLRFCRSLGYSGYTDFKISMAQQIGSFKQALYGDDAEPNRPEARAMRVLRAEADIIETTMRFLDVDKLTEAAALVVRAERICFFGAGTSFEVCDDAYRKFTRLGKAAWRFSDMHDAVLLISTFTEKDLVFCVSHSAQTREVLDVLTLAKRKRAKTALITAFPTQKLISETDVTLRSFSSEAVSTRLSLLSRVGQFATFDAMYITCVSLMGEEITERMQQTVNDLLATI